MQATAPSSIHPRLIHRHLQYRWITPAVSRILIQSS